VVLISQGLSSSAVELRSEGRVGASQLTVIVVGRIVIVGSLVLVIVKICDLNIDKPQTSVAVHVLVNCIPFGHKSPEVLSEKVRVGWVQASSAFGRLLPVGEVAVAATRQSTEVLAGKGVRNVGGVESLTITVWDTEAVLPQPSLTFQTRVKTESQLLEAASLRTGVLGIGFTLV